MNYYCLYTSEDNKKFDFISNSTIISLYMGIWDLILIGIKFIIKYFSKEKYITILFIIQIVISSIPSLIIGFIILCGLCYFSKLCYYICCCDNEFYEGFKLFNFLFCLISFILCLGGCWYNMDDVIEGSDCGSICENICYCLADCCCDCSCCYCGCCSCCCCCCDSDSCCYIECCEDYCDWIRWDCCYCCWGY